MLEILFGKTSLEGCFDQAYDTSAIAYVTEDDPPLLMIHGDADVVVPYAQATQMAKAMYDVKANCTLIKVDNGRHGFKPAQKSLPVEPDMNQIFHLTVTHLARYLEPALLGDLNMDGKRNVNDIFELALVYGMEGTDEDGNPAPDNWNPLADLEPDGVINNKDWKLFWRNY